MDRAARIAELQRAGYDVAPIAPEDTGAGVIHALKAKGQWLAYTLVVDRSGQLRFTATRVLEPARSLPALNLRRAYRVSREQQRITSILYQLTDGDDLSEVIGELERIADGD